MSEAGDSITLYRIGPLPSEAALIRQEALAAGTVPDWVQQAQEASGAAAASGRWFTADRQAVDWYLREHPDYPVRSITVAAADAAEWKAADHPSARRFASNPEHEFFLPADVADRAKLNTIRLGRDTNMAQTDTEVLSMKPGSASALKQRREAYQLTDRLSHDVDTAKSLVNFGLGKAALHTLEPTIEGIEKNPEAQRMVERHKPGMLDTAKELRAQAEVISQTEVGTIRVGNWQSDMDGAFETRVSLGKSDQGYHFMLEVSHGGGEPNASWSPGFKTEKDAEEAGSEAESRAHSLASHESLDTKAQEGSTSQVGSDQGDADTASDSKITVLERSEWTQDLDSLAESQVSIGQSDEGFHFRLTTSDADGKNVGPWSEAFPSKVEAQQEGQMAEDHWHDIQATSSLKAERAEAERYASEDAFQRTFKPNDDTAIEQGHAEVGGPEMRGKEAGDSASPSPTAAGKAETTTVKDESAEAGVSTTSKGQDDMSGMIGAKGAAETDPKAKQAAAIKRADDFWKGEIALKSNKEPAQGQTERAEVAAQDAAEKKKAAVRASV